VTGPASCGIDVDASLALESGADASRRAPPGGGVVGVLEVVLADGAARVAEPALSSLRE
jgi:hypothetical protein